MVSNRDVGVIHSVRRTGVLARQHKMRSLDDVLSLGRRRGDVHIVRDVADLVGEI